MAPEAKTGEGKEDPLYEKAVLVVRESRRGSISLVQRHLRIGYVRAERLLAAMVGSVIAEAAPTDKLIPISSGGEPAKARP